MDSRGLGVREKRVKGRYDKSLRGHSKCRILLRELWV